MIDTGVLTKRRAFVASVAYGRDAVTLRRNAGDNSMTVRGVVKHLAYSG